MEVMELWWEWEGEVVAIVNLVTESFYYVPKVMEVMELWWEWEGEVVAILNLVTESCY
jgi:hypothetical protein